MGPKYEVITKTRSLLVRVFRLTRTKLCSYKGVVVVAEVGPQSRFNKTLHWYLQSDSNEFLISIQNCPGLHAGGVVTGVPLYL